MPTALPFGARTFLDVPGVTRVRRGRPTNPSALVIVGHPARGGLRAGDFGGGVVTECVLCGIFGGDNPALHRASRGGDHCGRISAR